MTGRRGGPCPRCVTAAGARPAVDGRLAAVWRYPYDFGSADTGGQIRAAVSSSPAHRAGAGGVRPGGYAVLADATMPVIGDPETMNDTYLEQVTGAAWRTSGHWTRRDHRPGQGRLAGHSYAGFMTANLLANTTAFAPDRRSGAYNRTLTLFGSRPNGEATGRPLYDEVSPFRSRPDHRATAADPRRAGRQLGDLSDQSERLFQAIHGNGGTARLVCCPTRETAISRGNGHARARRGARLAAALARPGGAGRGAGSRAGRRGRPGGHRHGFQSSSSGACPTKQCSPRW